MIENNETRYLTPDHLGSPRVVTDSAGAVVSRRDFLPFGEEIGVGIGGRNAFDGYGNQDGIRQKFTGYERDDETGLDYAKARYYAGNLGRFQSADPLHASAQPVNPQTWNRYAYTKNNPLRFIDPSGMQDLPTTPLPQIAAPLPQASAPTDPPRVAAPTPPPQRRILYVFVGFSPTERSIRRSENDPWGVPEGDETDDSTIEFDGLVRELSNQNLEVRVVHGWASGEAGVRAAAAFASAVQDPNAMAVVFVGHATTGYFVFGPRGNWSHVGIVPASAEQVCAFGCHTVRLNGQFGVVPFVGVDSGPDQVTTSYTLSRMAYAAIVALARGRDVVAAANGVLQETTTHSTLYGQPGDIPSDPRDAGDRAVRVR